MNGTKGIDYDLLPNGDVWVRPGFDVSTAVTALLGPNGVANVVRSYDRTDAAPKPSATAGAGIPLPDREMDATNNAMLAAVAGGCSVSRIADALAVERRAWLKHATDKAVWTIAQMRAGL